MASLPEVSLITSWYAAPPLQPAPFKGPAGLVHALEAGQPLLDLYFLAHGDMAWYADASHRDFPDEVRNCPLALAAALDLADVKRIGEALRALVVEHYKGRLVGPRPRFAALATYWPHISADNEHCQQAVKAVRNSLLLARELGCQHVEIVGGAAFGSQDLANGTNLPKSTGTQMSMKEVFRAQAMNRLCDSLREVFDTLPSDGAGQHEAPYLCVEMEPGDAYLIQNVSCFLELRRKMLKHTQFAPRVLLNVDLAHVFLADASRPVDASGKPEPTQMEMISRYNLSEWIGHFHISDHARSHASDLCPGTYHFLRPDYEPWLKLAAQLMDQRKFPRFSGSLAVEMEGCADVHEVLRAVGRTQHWLRSIAPSNSNSEHQKNKGIMMAVDIVNSTSVFLRDGHSLEQRATVLNLAVSELCKAVHKANGSVYSFTGDGVIAFFDERHFPSPTHAAAQVISTCQSLFDDMLAAVRPHNLLRKDEEKKLALRIALHEGTLVVPSHGHLQHQALGADVVITCRMLNFVRQIMEEAASSAGGSTWKTGLAISGKVREQLSAKDQLNWVEYAAKDAEESHKLHGGFSQSSFMALTEGVFTRQTDASKINGRSAASIRGFVACDFSMFDSGDFGNLYEHTLEELKKRQEPPELELHWSTPDSHRPEGVIWRDFVKPQLDQAHKVLAFLDRANANVGYEIGYALGQSKPIALGRFKSTMPEWHSHPPMNMQFINQINTAEGVFDSFLKSNLIEASGSPTGGSKIMALCPDNPKRYYSGKIPKSWEREPTGRWDLAQISSLFHEVGLVVWVVLPPDDSEAHRDGRANSTFAILAGYALARPELTLRVLVHENAPSVADALDRSDWFKTNADLQQKLEVIHEQWNAGTLT